MKTCSVTDCERVATRKGLCNGHYRRLRRGQTLDKPLRVTAPPGTCSLPLCTNPRAAKGLCRTHYWRMRKGIDLSKPVRTPAKRRKNVAPRDARIAFRPLKSTWQMMKEVCERTGFSMYELTNLIFEEWAYNQRARVEDMREVKGDAADWARRQAQTMIADA